MAIAKTNRNSEFVKNEINNVSSNIIRITEDKLRLKLSVYENSVVHSSDWLGALGIVVSIAMTLITAEFKNLLGLSSEVWCTIFVIALGISIVYLIRTICRASNRKSIDDFVEGLND